jgi:hypothetical protein
MTLLLPQQLAGGKAGGDSKLPKTTTTLGMRQTIQARHGTATFVPKGHTITVVNTYGRQVVGFWGFALHKPPTIDEWEEDNPSEEEEEEATGEGNYENGDGGLGEVNENGSEGENEDELEGGYAEKEGAASSHSPETEEHAKSDEGHNGEASLVMVEKDEQINSQESTYEQSLKSQSSKSEEVHSGEGSHVMVEKEEDAELPSNEETKRNITEAIDNAAVEKDDSKTKDNEIQDTLIASSGDVEKGSTMDQESTVKVHDTEVKVTESESGGNELPQREDEEDKTGNNENKETATTSQKSDIASNEDISSRGWASYIPSVHGRGKKVEKAPGEQSRVEKTETTAKSASKGWGSYLPSVRGLKRPAKPQGSENAEEEKTWGSYIPSGQGFSNYLPNKSAISSFASLHQIDSSKSVAEQLYDFSKTPVGAAGLSGKFFFCFYTEYSS